MATSKPGVHLANAAGGRYRRRDVVDRAIALLDEEGLDGWSMRRLGAELGVQPSALYHHFRGKDELMVAVADELLARGRRPAEIVTWEWELRLACVELRDALRSHRDAARLIADVHAKGTGAQEPRLRMEAALVRAGADDDLARVGARMVVRFAFAHVDDETADFLLGLDILLDGLGRRLSPSS